VRCLPYTEQRQEAFKAILQASYEQTLDCPGLLGVRELDDVLAGHKSTGQFDPAMWTLLVEGDEPAGVALFNRLDELNGAELVYLGLPQRSRGKGYGSLLVRRGLAQCANIGASTVSLAVDQSNDPAVRLYRRLGFYRVARKRAMTKVVSVRA
jgi:mycothiol synthase